MRYSESELLAMGDRIARLRADHGYKQQWIADQCGVTLRTYQFWQAGKSPPKQEHLEKLAELFGVSVKYIMRGETPDLLATQAHIDERLQRTERQLAQIQDQLDRLLRQTGEGDLTGRDLRMLEALRRLLDQQTGQQEAERPETPS